MRVLVAGASGAIGLPVVRLLRKAGHEVTALYRSPQSRSRLAGTGADLVRADVLDRHALSRALDGRRVDAVIAELTAPRQTRRRTASLAATTRLRTAGTANLLTAAQRLGALRFVTASIVFGYGFGAGQGKVLTEADPFALPGRGRLEGHLAALRHLEDQVLGAGRVDGIVLRYGQPYGPGASDVLVARLRRRRLPVTRGGGPLPWVYVDDAASATVAALLLGERGTAYNVADDQPVSMTVMLTAMAEAVGAPRPRAAPRWLLAPGPCARAVAAGGLRVSSARAKAELGWVPRVPTYRDGLRLLARHHRA